MIPGKGFMTVTGNLREVMKESISAAASYVRSRAVDDKSPTSMNLAGVHCTSQQLNSRCGQNAA
jgi:ATP-dependent Lon protease